MSRRSNVQSDLEALLDKKTVGHSDTEESSSEDYQSRSQQRMGKLQLLQQIRNLLVGILVSMGLTLIMFAITGFYLWANSGPMFESIENARLITGRVNGLLEPGAQVSSIMTNVNAVTSKLPSMQQFIENLIREELISMIADIKAGLRLVAKADGLMDSFSNVDPNDLIAFAEHNQIAQRGVRILAALNDMLNRLEDPATQKSLDTMTKEANDLLTAVRTLMSSVHQTGLGLTVKI